MHKMHNTPITDELKKFNGKDYIKFFMPGHNQLKMKKDYSIIQRKVYDTLNEFNHNIFFYDVTEIADFDNLANPEGIIRQSEKNVSSSYGAEDAFFLVNGSTSGVLSMIFSVTNYNDSIIVQKNSHKSVHNACRLNNLKTAYINQRYNEKFDIYEKIDICEIEKAVSENKNAKAIVITSPDYFGNDQDIKKISQIAHKNNMYLLVDAAHSAHYPYSSSLPDFAIKNGADIVVASFHKTLPSFNQTAVLLTGKNIDRKKIQENVNIFQTTSPSYIFLSSIELSDEIMKKYGEILYKELLENIEKFKIKTKDMKNIEIMDNDDKTRIVIRFENIQKAYEIIYRDFAILPEMANDKSMVFIANIFHTKEDFDRLFEAVSFIEKNNFETENKESEKSLKKIEIINNLKLSLGKKINHNIYIYPPGTPVITKGEVFTKKHMEKLEKVIYMDSVDIIK